MGRARFFAIIFSVVVVMTMTANVFGVTRNHFAREKTLFQEKPVIQRAAVTEEIRDKDAILDEIRKGLHKTGKIDPTLVGKLIDIEKTPTAAALAAEDENEVGATVAVTPIDMKGALKNLNEDDIVESIRYQSEGGANFAKQHPRVLRFIVRLARDEVAFNQILSIPANKKKMLIFSGIFFVIMIMGWVMKGSYHSDSTIFQKLFRRLAVFIFVVCAEVLLFALFFYKELTPAWTIFRQTFF